MRFLFFGLHEYAGSWFNWPATILHSVASIFICRILLRNKIPLAAHGQIEKGSRCLGSSIASPNEFHHHSTCKSK